MNNQNQQLNEQRGATIEELREAFRIPEAEKRFYEIESVAWDMYFSGLVAFQLHPGNKMAPQTIDIEPYAKLADRMILARRRRFIPWHG